MNASVLVSLISLILVVIFQYTLPMIRDNKIMKIQLLNVYTPLFKCLDSPKKAFIDTFSLIEKVHFAYIPSKLRILVTAYSTAKDDAPENEQLRKDINLFIRKQYSICQNNLKFDQHYIGILLISKQVLRFFISVFIGFSVPMILLVFIDGLDLTQYLSFIIKFSLAISLGFSTFLFIALVLKESKGQQ